MKVLSILGKVVASVVSFPFALVGGLLYGLLIAVCYMCVLPFAVIADIWDI